MRYIALGLAFLAGCSLYFKDDPGQAIEPRTCAANVSLSAWNNPGRGARLLELDDNGVDLCIHADASGMTFATLMVSSQPVPGTSSHLLATLEDASHTPIVEGNDTTTSVTRPDTSMELQWDAPPSVTNVVLWIRADSGPVTSEVSIDLFDLGN